MNNRFEKDGRHMNIIYTLGSEGIHQCDNPSTEVFISYFKMFPEKMLDYDEISEDIQVEVIKSKPDVIIFMQSPCDNSQIEAIKQTWNEYFYNTIIDVYTRQDQDHFEREIKKMKLLYGPMKSLTAMHSEP